MKPFLKFTLAGGNKHRLKSRAVRKYLKNFAKKACSQVDEKKWKEQHLKCVMDLALYGTMDFDVQSVLKTTASPSASSVP